MSKLKPKHASKVLDLSQPSHPPQNMSKSNFFSSSKYLSFWQKIASKVLDWGQPPSLEKRPNPSRKKCLEQFVFGSALQTASYLIQ